MKKTLLTLLGACALSAFAQETTAPTPLWAKILDGNTTAGDQNTGVAYGPNGTAYWLASVASTADNLDAYYDGAVIFQGSPYENGTSQDNNLCLLATNADGSKKWVVYSNRGDYANNAGTIATDSEDNVIIAFKVRHSYMKLNEQMNFIDAAGKKVEFGGTIAYESNYGAYGILLAKFDSNGNYVWHKYLDTNDVPDASVMPGAVTKGHVVDGVHLKAMAIDNDDNLYISGRYIMPFNVAEGVTLPARNVTSFNGDGTQEKVGNFYILKFDNDGNYISNIIGKDGLTMSEIIALTWNGSNLYAQGAAQGKAGSKIEVGDKSADCNTQQCPFFVQFDADLSAKWLKGLLAEGVQGGSAVVQNSGITVCNGTLWFAGQFNGKYTDADNENNSAASATKSTREGLIIKFDANDGDWIAATTSRSSEFTPAAAKTGITGYLKILQSPEKPENIYVFGYVMNATVGVFLREYNAETLEANLDHAWTLVKGGGSPTAQAIAHDPDNNVAYASVRGRGVYNVGEISTPSTTTWSLCYAKFDMPADLKYSGITNVGTDSENAPVEYYNLQGVRMNGDNLTPGIYIRRQGQKAEKILVR